MKLINFIYLKFFYSFFLCVFTSFFIFYIFSLLGNLGKKIDFNEIIFVSLLNSLEILSSIPSFVVFLTLIIFLIILKSNNEIFIIKEYFSFKKILIIFLPFIIFFSIVEINKFNLSRIFVNLKNEYLNLEKDTNNKIIINSINNEKTILVLKGIDSEKSKITEFQKYKVNENLILSGEFSKEIQLIDDKLIATDIYKYEYKTNEILKTKKPNIILDNYSKYNNKNSIYNFTKDKTKFDFFLLIKFLNLIIFFCCLFLISFNKKNINLKNNSYIHFIICFGLLIYSQMISSIKIIQHNYIFNIFILLFFALVFIRYYKYE